MYRNYKMRAYLTKSQISLVERTFYDTRYVYNAMLERSKKAYERRKERLSYIDMQNLLPEMKIYDPWLEETDSQALKYACRQLDAAYKNFFKKHTGFPRYKSRKANCQSYTSTATSIKLHGDRIYLPVIGYVKVKNSYHLNDDVYIEKATMKRTPSGKYFITACVKTPDKGIPDIEIAEDDVVGLDYKSNGLYEDSNGYIPGSPKYYRKYEKKLAHLERMLSKKKGSKKGEAKSSNYLKEKHKLAVLCEKIANMRKDFLDKLSTEIANWYDAVCIEDLDMKAMSNKGFGNGKATLDNGYGMFTRMLEYKLKDRGKQLVRVSRWYPSTQTCSICGYVLTGENRLSLKDRDWICPACGARHDRDHNAAVNIRLEGLRILMEEGYLTGEAA